MIRKNFLQYVLAVAFMAVAIIFLENNRRINRAVSRNAARQIHRDFSTTDNDNVFFETVDGFLFVPLIK